MRISLPSISPSGKLALIYLSVSIAWIILGDLLALRISGNDVQLLDSIQATKGIVFVLLSAALIYFLGERFNAGLRSSYERNEGLQKKFDALKIATREGILDLNLEEDKARINDKMKFFFPDMEDEIVNFLNVFRLRIHPEDVEAFSQEYYATMMSNRHSWQTEFRLLGTDERYYNVILNAYVLRLDTGKPIRLIGAIQDFTDLRNLQLENYEQQLRYKRTMSQIMIKAQEKERERWAGELHDNVCQLLSVARMYVEDMRKFPDHRDTLLPETAKIIMDSITEIRQLSASIQSPVFDKKSLLQAIEELVANINRVHPFDFEMESKDFDESLLSKEHKLMVYRVVQEQLNNITKYAVATQVRIQLETQNKNVNIEVTDNGKGFDPKNVKTGIGLKTMRGRLQAFGGALNIRSAPGMGCRLSAHFEIPEESLEPVTVSL